MANKVSFALEHYLPVYHDEYLVRPDIIKDSPVMSDDKAAFPIFSILFFLFILLLILFPAHECIDSFSNNPERDDVEAGISLVKDGKRRVEHKHLQDLGFLL